MISFHRPLPAGAAVELYVAPPPGAADWRILRRTVAGFSGPDDAGAVIVVDASVDDRIVDHRGLENGITYAYAIFYRDAGGGWIGGPPAPVTVTPQAGYGDGGTDPLTFLLARFDVALRAEVKAGRLKPPNGQVKVVNSPFQMAQEMTFPVVSIHLDSDEPAERFVGEQMPSIGGIGEDGDEESAGWLSRYSFSVVGMSRNVDERSLLRQALKRIVLANLPVFEAEGLTMVGFTQADSERPPVGDNAVLFATAGTFSCLAPSLVVSDQPIVAGVDLFSDTFNMEPPRGL